MIQNEKNIPCFSDEQKKSTRKTLIKSLKKELFCWRLGALLFWIIYIVVLINGLSYFSSNDSTSLITQKTVIFTAVSLVLLALALANTVYSSRVSAYTAVTSYDVRHSVSRCSSASAKLFCCIFNPVSLIFFLRSKKLIKENKELFNAIASEEKETVFKPNFFPTKKKLMQLYFALLINSNLHGFFSGYIHMGESKKFCVPGINCYSCPGAVGACPIGSFQGSFKGGKSAIFYVGGILLLYSIMFGRMICGWICPFGFIQDLLHKIKTPKLKKNRFTRILSGFKYVILIFFVFIVPIAYALRNLPLPEFCKYICPAGTLEGGVGLLSNRVNDSYFSMLGPLFTWKFALMISIILACIFIYRMFCRFICPLGALYSLFNRYSLFGIKVDNSKCVNCSRCVHHCKMDIKKVGDRECISCGECASVCPTGAIEWKGPKAFKKFSNDPKYKTARNITRGIVTALLLGALFAAFTFFWQENDKAIIPNKIEQTDPNGGNTDTDFVQPEVGNTEGLTCPGYDLEIVTADGVSSKTVDPSKTGKITVINFWGTWCTPCVGELPYFDRIASEYADDVDVIAIHSFMLCESEPDFIKETYPDSSLIFARDHAADNNGSYYSTLGGRGTYPYTVILDERGVISKIFVSSVDYDDLKTEIEKIINN